MNKRNGSASGNVELRLVKNIRSETRELEGLRVPRYVQSFGREAFGQLVVQWRLEHELSADEFADDAGFSVEVVKQIECGDGLPSTRHLLTLAELMELSFEKLLRLVGLVTVEDDELLEAALRFLAATSHTSLNSEEHRQATLHFRELLKPEEL
jgi:transcriptional regulator with XRE-family HTH domain